ncbi:hypothetical protein NCLIV_053490 [Neospora caninum Liverpool]|uniref:Histone RNA hairpin-binding protein RNA-binding domain-containing protein n=1 Tax=Neospora caninum (strain Liverpool) TaxID=572307 RepID=F0VMH7_NEOCL|nr:hypothetical protein NCLIV_053490 [Neospora caninum Liverpool]CBZ54923.1 hypothetical protein NCLIV_053490 [Neospora caninum Liverpool]CEL69645.1 TPA: hypothetical protein BN1204_053490 [Neospora caninum Liverpool]|eukprot:XP_003884951.1 hypothetical protein NCLIV_053490 [Neospora caninum Liverpool]
MTFLGGVRWADISSDTQSLSAMPCTPKGSSSYCGSLGGGAAATALLLQHEAAEHSYLNPSSCAAEFENSSAGLNLHFRSAANLGGAEADAINVPSPSAASGLDGGGDCDGMCERFGWEGRSGSREAKKNAGVSSSTATTPGFKGLLGFSSSHEHGEGRGTAASSCASNAALISSGSGRACDKHGSPSGSSLTSVAGAGKLRGRGRPTPGASGAARPQHSVKAGQKAANDDADACANWRRAAPGPRDALTRAPALTPAKRNRRASGGSCRTSSTLVGRDSLTEEDEKPSVAAPGSAGEGVLVGLLQSQQPPSKKKRSLHTNPAQGREQKGCLSAEEEVSEASSLKGTDKAGAQSGHSGTRSQRNSASAMVGSTGGVAVSGRKSGGGRRSVGSSRGSAGAASSKQPAGTNLLLQHMGSISAPFLQIPGFVSPMFLPTLSSPVAGGAPAVGPAALGLSFLPHPNAKTAEASGEVDEEDWARRESARMKDIAIGKATEGYRNFIRAIPKDQRREGDPATPDPKQRCTKAQFQREYQDWRKQLHRYDSCGVRGLSPVENANTHGEEAFRDAKQEATGEGRGAELGIAANLGVEARPATEGETVGEVAGFTDETDPILEFNRECELAGL